MEESTKEHLVRINSGSVTLEGSLLLPAQATGVVLFAHGSGSSRHSPRNKFVAQTLNQAGLGTLLLDLLTLDEEAVDNQTQELRFNIDLLAERLIDSSRWLMENPRTAALPIGLFGSSTGAAAALIAAAKYPEAIRAVVSRGGRPDLAGDALSQVRAPTLLIVGGRDVTVMGLNRQAFERLRAKKELEIVPGATHLFEEPDTLEQVAHLAQMWFTTHFSPVTQEK